MTPSFAKLIAVFDPRRLRSHPETWVVEDNLGDVWALRASQTAAEDAVRAAEETLYEAAACGHPRAPRWAEDRRPIQARRIGRRETEQLVGIVPLLDREP